MSHPKMKQNQLFIYFYELYLVQEVGLSSWMAFKTLFKKYVETDQICLAKFIKDLYVDKTASDCSSVDKGMKFYRKVRLLC